MENKKLITFQDNIGRTILAEQVVGPEEDRLRVRNPVILHAQPNSSGQLNIQTIPLYFREFLGQKTKDEGGSVWSYPLSNIVLGVNVENEDRLVTAYWNMWAPPAPAISPKTVKLFDDVESAK